LKKLSRRIEEIGKRKLWR